MAVTDAITSEIKAGAERIGNASLVVALPSCTNQDSLYAAGIGLQQTLAYLSPGERAVILHSPAIKSQAALQGPVTIEFLSSSLAAVERYHQPSMHNAMQTLLGTGTMLNARACIIIGSEMDDTTGEDICALAEPVLRNGYDLALPLYPRRKFESLINSALIYPLTRALYGSRLRFPMAPDLALSLRLAERYLTPVSNGHAQREWVSTAAVCAGMQVCEVHRAFKSAPATEPADLSASIAQVLGTLFVDLESTVTFWQRVRVSQPVRIFGQPVPQQEESAPVNASGMVESFQRGCRDLTEVWSAILSPATLVEFRKLAKKSPLEFRIEPELWAHAVFDFALGYHQRVINREHLLRAITPLYLGWVASYANAVQDTSPQGVDEQVETLAAAFESLKPYLLSRWRWPDRFNP
jgi:hypothetical protein